MSSQFTFITILIKTVNKFDKLIKPAPEITPNKTQRKIDHKRNRAIIAIHSILLLAFFIDMIFNKISIQACIFRLFYCIGVFVLVVLSSNKYPQLFKLSYFFLFSAYGPLMVNVLEDNIFKAWLSALLIPMFLYSLTGSLWYFTFQAIIQTMYLNTYYLSLVQKALIYKDPEALAKSLRYSTNLNMMYNVLIVILTHYFLQQAYKKLAIVEKKKDEFENQKTFLLGFSHELRNLINSLIGNVKLASLELLTQQAKELLLNAEVCGELLLHLITNILDTGKVDIGELEINMSSNRIYDTLERIWGICSELIRRKNIKGTMRIHKNLPKSVMLDHYRITQIMLSLVGNAVKFTQRGSIHIAVSWINHLSAVDETCFHPFPFNEDLDGCDEGLFEKEQQFSILEGKTFTLDTNLKKINHDAIEKSSGTVKGILKIIVTDTGCGMTNEEMGKLFQKFSQITSDNNQRKLGTGLGLYIAKQLCQKMKGEIRVFSKKGKGSSFIFCLPVDIVQEKEKLLDSESLRVFLASKKLKAMIVDDTPFSHNVLKFFFQKLGIEVVDAAVNGLEAYQKYIRHTENGIRPQIITMDLDMPVMDGKLATEKIRQFELDRGLEPSFLIIVSGNCTESEINECLDKRGKIKADEFLKKPATIEELLRVIGYHFIQKQDL